MKLKDQAKFMWENHVEPMPLRWFEHLSFKWFWRYLKYTKAIFKKDSILSFTYETNTQCTLRCKECHSCMPYFPKDKQYMANFEDFKKEVTKVLKSVNYIVSFRFQGGETLLVKDLAKMLNWAAAQKRILHIQVVTNCTVIPSQELLDVMKNPKIILNLSDYRSNKDLANILKNDEIIDLCKKNNIRFQYFIHKNDTDLWFARRSFTMDRSNENNLDLAWENRSFCWEFCPVKLIIAFKGKIYNCHTAAAYDQIYPDFVMPEGEVFDIIETPQKEFKQKLDNMLAQNVCKICTRCNAAKLKATRVPSAQQIAPDEKAELAILS